MRSRLERPTRAQRCRPQDVGSAACRNLRTGAHGYQIVRFAHRRGKSPASCEGLSAQNMIKAIRSIDGPDGEAIVAFGATRRFARLADEAERWLDKPVLQINATTYWHALRTNGIADKVYG